MLVLRSEPESDGREYGRGLEASRCERSWGRAGGGIEDFLFEAGGGFVVSKIGAVVSPSVCSSPMSSTGRMGNRLVAGFEASCGSMLVRREPLWLRESISTIFASLLASCYWILKLLRYGYIDVNVNALFTDHWSNPTSHYFMVHSVILIRCLCQVGC